MKKKWTYSVATFLLLAGSGLVPVNAEANTLDEMEQEKQELEMRSGDVQDKIQTREQQMQDLQAEQETLEKEIHTLQTSIDELVMKLHDQENKLVEINEKIKKLQNEIEALKEQIAQREEKLKHQARAVQTQGDTTTLLNVIVSAENLSDLVGRIGVVNQLVNANKDIVTEQVNDQQALLAVESQVQVEREEIEAIQAQMQTDRDNLVHQKVELDNKIIQVAEMYNMNAEEKEAFVQEQQVIAQQTSTLDNEMQAERDRILEEERARMEAIRKAEAERARKEAEERAIAEAEAQKEAEAQAKAEEEAKAEERAKAESKSKSESKSKEKEKTVTVAKAKDEKSSKTNSQSSNTDANAQAEAEEKAREEARAQERAREAAKEKAAAEKAAEKRAEERRAEEERERKAAAAEKARKEKAKPSSGFIRPASGYVSSHYGYRLHPIFKYPKLHAGLDLAGGGPIVAAQSGKVVAARYDSGWGYYVKIDHGDGLQTLYAHMKAGSLRVSPGQSVSQGQQIGVMGTTGSSTGIHLHFEVYKNGRTTNPAPYLGL